jgi:hypothetical protein
LENEVAVSYGETKLENEVAVSSRRMFQEAADARYR